MNIYPALRRHALTCPHLWPLPITEWTTRHVVHTDQERAVSYGMRCECGWFLWVAA